MSEAIITSDKKGRMSTIQAKTGIMASNIKCLISFLIVFIKKHGGNILLIMAVSIRAMKSLSCLSRNMRIYITWLSA